MSSKQIFAFLVCPFFLYYALMYFLKDDYPNEYKKMGAKLKETVEEIINKVRHWEKDYA